MVFLLNALVPNHLATVPYLLTAEQLAVALQAAEEAKAFLPKAPLVDALHMCHDVKATWKVRPVLNECISAYRSELYKNIEDPFHRLQLHEAIMAAGFLHRSAHHNVVGMENRRFMVNHYNFDVRRDSHILKAAQKALHFYNANPAAGSQEFNPEVNSVKESPVAPALSAENEKLITDLLLIERRLFGKNRFISVGGRQSFLLGLPAADVHSEEELNRFLSAPVIRQHGNFVTTEGEIQDANNRKADRWKKTIVTCAEEASEPVIPPEEVQKLTAADVAIEVHTLLPAPPLSWREALREKLLRWWVIFVSAWLMFWFVDEELIALGSMIIIKWRQMRLLDQERERMGERKLYIAQHDNGVRYTGTPRQY